jgi:hypothetical protein
MPTRLKGQIEDITNINEESGLTTAKESEPRVTHLGGWRPASLIDTVLMYHLLKAVPQFIRIFMRQSSF